MKRVEAPCPACGAPVEFKTSSALVTVCAHCQSAVARGDRRLEDLGKVAALVPTASPFELGTQGRYDEQPFELVGHVQYRHAAGGMWDEWYAAFPNERWGWVAEAQGRIYLTFQHDVSADGAPPLGGLSAGGKIDLGEAGAWTVGEAGTASASGAAGEIPYAFVPGAAHPYADLAGPNGRFATLDYSEAEPLLFVGKQVSLDDLGISAAAAARTRADAEAVAVGGKLVACPNCGGSLDLKAPDQTQRVTCPFCSAVLDADHGDLKYLSTLEQTDITPTIPIGSEGTLFDVHYTVIGFLRRAVYFDREYTWDEYLLYEPTAGFRWLAHSDGHWSFVTPLSPGDVELTATNARYNGRRFKVFQRADATVKHVLGEFYWKVSVGETVSATDYIDPPEMITAERSYVTGEGGSTDDAEQAAPPAAPPAAPSSTFVGFDDKGAVTEPADARLSGRMEMSYVPTEEINVSLGTYVTRDVIEQAFGVGPLRPGWGVAPNQPPPGPKGIWLNWLVFVAAIVGIDLGMSAVMSQPIDHWLSFWAVVAVTLMPIGSALYAHSFERSRWADSQFSPYSSGDDDSDDGTSIADMFDND